MLSWDSSHDWVVQRYYNELARVTIQFERGRPSVGELLAVRRCLPQFSHTPPAELRASLGGTGSLFLGEMPTREARRLAESAQGEGLHVLVENASFVSYLPFDRTLNLAWLIEDEAEARAVAESMISAGVPVKEVEA